MKKRQRKKNRTKGHSKYCTNMGCRGNCKHLHKMWNGWTSQLAKRLAEIYQPAMNKLYL